MLKFWVNYNSGEWFEQSYKVLNKDYKIIAKKEDNKKDSFINRIIKKLSSFDGR